jgi:hypothetical protein
MNLQTSNIYMIIGFAIIAGILIIIINQIRMLNAISSLKEFNYMSKDQSEKINEEPVHYNVSEPSGPQIIKGQTKLEGIEDGEIVAVIMAVVSAASNIPLTSMKIKSIRKIG